MNITGTLHSSLDKLIIVPLLGFTILGNYNLAIQAINIMLISSSVFYKYLLPQEATGVKNKNAKILIVCISVLISILGIFVAPILIDGFFPKGDTVFTHPQVNG